MPYKIGVTSGLHYVARSEELATVVKKLGFGLTRGTTCVEIAMDVPHEVTETEGVEVRHIAQKQEVDVLMHGSLTIPMGIPERSDWRDAQDHIEKSIISATRAGAKYVDFHACLNIWLELMTYTSRKLTMSFCDHEGRFISHILQESAKLRDWFVEYRGNDYIRDILTQPEMTELNSRISNEEDDWLKGEIKERLSVLGVTQDVIERVYQSNTFPEMGMSSGQANAMAQRLLKEGKSEKEVEAIIAKEQEGRESLQKRGTKAMDDIKRERIKMNADIQKRIIREMLTEKLAEGREWDSEELRAAVGILDGYHIMAHYMFFEKDPMWIEMARMYEGDLRDYKMDYDDPKWLHNAWRKAENHNDRKFKEFFYGAVAAKFLEGHMKRALKWRDDTLIPKVLAGNPKLQQIAKNLILAIEIPDARDPQHAGLHLLWSNRQVYVAVKVIRKVLNTNSVWILTDFEHSATQGVDPIIDMQEVIKLAPDFGTFTISCHANAPNPSHAHEPLELGDIRVYKLLYMLRKTGFGKNGTRYVIYERGGGDDPFKRSVESLRLAISFLEQDVPPEKLPAEFFGYRGAVAGDEQRQSQIIKDHAWEPLKDLMEMPDEEFTLLGQAAIRKGKKPEQWKKAEFR